MEWDVVVCSELGNPELGREAVSGSGEAEPGFGAVESGVVSRIVGVDSGVVSGLGVVDSGIVSSGLGVVDSGVVSGLKEVGAEVVPRFGGSSVSMLSQNSVKATPRKKKTSCGCVSMKLRNGQPRLEHCSRFNLSSWAACQGLAFFSVAKHECSEFNLQVP